MINKSLVTYQYIIVKASGKILAVVSTAKKNDVEIKYEFKRLSLKFKNKDPKVYIYEFLTRRKCFEIDNYVVDKRSGKIVKFGIYENRKSKKATKRVRKEWS